MKHFFLAFTAIFFGITSSTLAQSNPENDSLQFEEVKNKEKDDNDSI